jgi:hypothetical protein
MDDWRARIGDCGDAELAAALIASIEDLFALDAHLLTVNAHENTLAARLMSYLQPRVGAAPDGVRWDVDFDYNRQRARVKTVRGYQVVRPDLIIHRRNTDSLNYLAVEIKKGASESADEGDVFNLEAYKWPLEAQGLAYKYALFLRFGVQAQAGQVTCVHWV